MHQFLRALLLLAGLHASQAVAVEHAPGVWLAAYVNGTLGADDATTRWRYSMDAQHRSFDIGTGITQSLLRPGVGYAFNDSMTAWLGYARFRASDRAGDVVNEDRYWQQFNWRRPNTLNGSFALRLRLEERNIDAADDTRWVFRVRGKYSRPLKADSRAALLLAIESFFDMNNSDWGGGTGLSQNRVFMGLSWQLSDTLSAEGGYMHQFFRAERGENRANHLAMLALRWRL